MTKDIGSLRSTLEYLEATGELVTTDVQVEPHLEVAAIQEHVDGGATLLFNKVKGSGLRRAAGARQPVLRGETRRNQQLATGHGPR